MSLFVLFCWLFVCARGCLFGWLVSWFCGCLLVSMSVFVNVLRCVRLYVVGGFVGVSARVKLIVCLIAVGLCVFVWLV